MKKQKIELEKKGYTRPRLDKIALDRRMILFTESNPLDPDSANKSTEKSDAKTNNPNQIWSE